MSEQQLTMIPIELLVFSGRNPRTEMRDLERLAENIGQYGILEPIVVRPKEDKFEIVVGGRRVKASMLAELKEIPAIIRGLTDRETDELRLIENVHRDDLTNPEKGDAIWTLIENYPEKYPSIKSVCDALSLSYNLVRSDWCAKSRKLSDFVKECILQGRLTETDGRVLIKYDHLVQDTLARFLLDSNLNYDERLRFLGLYAKSPNASLDKLRDRAKGVQIVKVALDELSDYAREEVKQLLEFKKKQGMERLRSPESRKKMKKSLRKTIQRKKKAKMNNAILKEPLLPREKERLQKITEREYQKILQERRRKGKFMQIRAELTDSKIKLPSTPTRDSATILARRRVMDGKRLNSLEAKDWMIFSKSWFIHNPPPRGDEELHPAKFPESMIRDFIEFFTQPTEIVLDPFLGTASTLVACDMSNRQGIGVEIEERYANVAKRRTNQLILVGDARNLDELSILKDLKGEVDFVITSPPYWNMLKKSRGHVRSVSKIRNELGADVFYKGKAGNLENIEDYEEYLEALHQVFGKVHKLLRNNCYLVVIIQNILTEDGKMKSVAWDLAKKLSDFFLLKQERIWCQDNKPLGCWGYPYRYVSNVHHHYCLVFEKVQA